jgi:hypothetical protein
MVPPPEDHAPERWTGCTFHAASMVATVIPAAEIPTADDTRRATSLDVGFGKAVAAGYVLGFVALGAFFFAVLSWATDTIPFGARVAVAAGIAFWIGVMGGVVMVGRWALRHEDELHG